MHRLVSLGLVLCGAVAATQASAQGGPPPGAGARQSADTITVGLGVGVTTSYDGAKDYRVIPGGALRGTVKGHDFQLNGLQLFVDAVPNDNRRKVDIEFGPWQACASTGPATSVTRGSRRWANWTWRWN